MARKDDEIPYMPGFDFLDEMASMANTEPPLDPSGPEGPGDYGRSASLPIETRSLIGSRMYLSAVRTEDGNRVRFDRTGSVMPKAFKRPVDRYRITSMAGGKTGFLYLFPYATRTSMRAPEGYRLNFSLVEGVPEGASILPEDAQDRDKSPSPAPETSGISDEDWLEDHPGVPRDAHHHQAEVASTDQIIQHPRLGSTDKGMRFLISTAEAGDAEAQLLLGRAYMGCDGPADAAHLADFWLAQAARSVRKIS